MARRSKRSTTFLSQKRQSTTRHFKLESLEPRRVLESTVVFNELMYHPVGDSGDQQEWVELYNQLAVDVDLSGWHLSAAVNYQFPAGTRIPSGGHVLIAADPIAFQRQTGFEVFGPLEGRLSNNGERLELRNKSGRLMDHLDYGDDDPWPVSPDGSGSTLAKSRPMSGSVKPENWAPSDYIGGTPLAENFPPFTTEVQNETLIDSRNVWRWSDLGQAPAKGWQDVDFDDAQWSVDTAPFVAGRNDVDTSLFEPITTLYNTGLDEQRDPLRAGRPDERWMLSSGKQAIAMTPGGRLDKNETSSWIGTVGSGRATVAPGEYTFRTQIDLSDWISSSATIDVRVAVDDILTDLLVNGQSTGMTAAGADAWSEPLTINNGFFAGINTLEFVISNEGNEPSPSGLRVEMQGSALPIQLGTRMQDESTTYYFRKSFPFLERNAEISIGLESLIDDGGIFYLNGEEIYRHNLPPDVNHTTHALTEVTFATPTSQYPIPVDQLIHGRNVLAAEIHRAGPVTDDVQFDAVLTVDVVSQPTARPPHVAFSEFSAVSDDEFWIEIVNLEDHAVNLNGYRIVESGMQKTHQIDSALVSAHGRMLINESQLGFRPRIGARLFLVTPDGASVIDARPVAKELRGRSPQHDGRWLYPAIPTPGEQNQFTFHDELVINEIQYHARPTLEIPNRPPSRKVRPLVSLDSSWVFNESGHDLGQHWYHTTYDANDLQWFSGQGPFGYETGSAANLIETKFENPRTIDPSVTTYYFQTQFEFAGDLNQPGLELQLAHLVDDGAVFYLNGEEITRFKMPDGPIDATTFARRVGNAKPVGPHPLPVEHLKHGTNVLSVEVHQNKRSDSDIFFNAQLTIAEPTGPPKTGRPFAESPEEWIELYNRSDRTIDLTGWRLTNAVDFKFPVGTLIGPQNYLVVANDQRLMREIYPDLKTIVGEFDGTLSNRSDEIVLLDSASNPVDSVRYYDAENWPANADGQGSTLERIDAAANGRRAATWAPSDERHKTSWQHVSYRDNAASFPGTNDPDRWNEFIVGLLSAGEILLDDLSVIEDPDGAATELIQNGSFDQGVDRHRLVGNHGFHGLSGVVPDPDNPSNSVLHVVATGPGEHMSNHLETTFVDNRELDQLKEYEVSFRVRWLSGSGLVNTRSYFNRMARTTVLDLPRDTGTPGARNSVAQSNQGPTYANLSHSPTFPRADEEATISIRAEDPHGVKDLWVWYSTTVDEWHQVPMSSVNGHYQAKIPSHPPGTVVQFYVEGSDLSGAVSTMPAGGQDSRALYVVKDHRDQATNQHSFRLIMTDADVEHQLQRTHRMSNHRLGATVFTGDEVYYDVRTRLKGSGFGRGGETRGYNIRFHPNQLLRGVHDVVSIDRKDNRQGLGASHREIVHKHIGTVVGGVPELYDDLIYFIPPDDRSLIGPAQLQLSRYDRDFMDSTYENGTDGTRFEMELIYSSGVSIGGIEGLKTSPNNVLGVEISDLGDDKEGYRWNFLIKNQRLRDDYRQIIELGKTLSLVGSENGSELDQRSREIMDVDAWSRTFAYMVLGGIGDSYVNGGLHNIQFYVRPQDHRVVPLPWDQDGTFNTPGNAALFGSNHFRKVMEIPHNLHFYYGHLHDMVSTTFNVEYLKPWIEHYAEFLRLEETLEITNYIALRNAYVWESLPETIEFAVDNHDSLVTNTDLITLSGRGWIDVREIRLRDAHQPLEVEWLDETHWQLSVPVDAGTNALTFDAFDLQGEVVGTSTVNVTSTLIDRPLEQFLRVSEIMYNPSGPTTEERNEGFNDNDEFEFIELVNIGSQPLELSGVRLTNLNGEGVEFAFETSSIKKLPPGQTLLVVEDVEAFQSRYGDQLPVAGQWVGRLDNRRETITLSVGDRTTIQQFTYEDSWHPTTDGGGDSLVIVDAHHRDLNRWSFASGWQASQTTGGTPGSLINVKIGDVDQNGLIDAGDIDELAAAIRRNDNQPQFDINKDGTIDLQDHRTLIQDTLKTQAGDANLDGVFDARDLIFAMIAGEYQDDKVGNSGWADGDWNGDGEFDSEDLVAAFQAGNFVVPAADPVTKKQ